MRRIRLLTVLLAALALFSVGGTAGAATSTQTAQATSQGVTDVKKKGVSAWNFDGVTDALRDSQVGWYYDWATDPQGISTPSGVEFVPMIWGSGAVNDADLARARASGTTLLGFNEPDLPGQADMPVQQALDLWPRLQDTGMRLGAPAVAYGGDTPGGWLDQFMQGAQARGYRVDFIPLHWYGADFDPTRATEQLRSYIQAVYDRYHKPIWLTEYALIDWSTGTARYPSQDQQAEFVRQSTAMLQQQSFVERYAWFTLSTSRGDGTGLYDGATATTVGAAYRSAG
ncbi:glycoside hydrolase family protein [Streptomyces thermoviolaceus]|uniref:RNA polymerase n=1 Tax=Streptomyces thermoviolaceus subsp. thermoviolaceus TaxID=66860 RepID=A0ABX0YT31_STRTL|nr:MULTISPECIES: glycoside hydrolase family protein [Streptomyces]MCM3264990.1 glycoside hydrolase family protein [Streptomyces thermoviolaceus]NJP15258.1 RNA polymerase [Streptomyces thermoviolaceus subsp. thermoviolaceus]RSR95473.1 RNA polymerase [Streptomyces sp. WAC00469]WTD50742.1 glycoside hydrolase family protein [Streptomyces thermoviolaceus]GGV76596.1 RNA polymerase [Streptomyces thermoviolaceus subsp. apingens]